MFDWEKNVRRVEPYVPGEQPSENNVIKLNTNENPYGPSDEIKKIMASTLDSDVLRKYPDPSASKLIDALADYHNISSDKLFVGVGSDDVLGMAFMTFFNSDINVLFPDISYSFYPVWAEMLRIPYSLCPLNNDFTINPEDYSKPNGGVVIANPNAPTGILLDKKSVIKIVEANDSVVIIDEAYIDFAPEGSSMIDLVDTYDNLLVVRTFSKSRSLAGLRIGYAIGNPKLIKYMNDVKYSYNSYTMNYPSIILGSSVIKDEEHFRTTIKKIINTRERFTNELKDRGFKVLPSSTNFVFASPAKVSAKDLFEAAKKEKIYVRYFNSPGIDEFLRITIGTDEEMDTFLTFIDEFLTNS